MFRCLDIQAERFYHQFGELEKVQEGMINFLCQVGDNDPAIALRAAARLAQITEEVVKASGKGVAWSASAHVRSNR